MKNALEEAKKSKIKVALSLSDPFCVIRHKSNFLNLLKNYTSIVFSNQEEAFTLLDTNVTQEALDILSQWTETVVLTMGEMGAVVSHNRETFYIDPFPAQVLDTTGAGDAFAAGYLYGMTNDFSPMDSGRIGATLAGTVIEQTGARYEGEAKKLIREKLGIRLALDKIFNFGEKDIRMMFFRIGSVTLEVIENPDSKSEGATMCTSTKVLLLAARDFCHSLSPSL